MNAKFHWHYISVWSIASYLHEIYKIRDNYYTTSRTDHCPQVVQRVEVHFLWKSTQCRMYVKTDCHIILKCIFQFPAQYIK